MELAVGFGTGEQRFTVPDQNLMGVLTPNPVKHGLTGEAEVRRALSAPIGAERLRERVKAGQRVVIVTSDLTRPLPSYKLLPPLLEELHAGGVRDEDVTVVFGLGSHRRQTIAEQKKLVGESVFNSIRCVDSDPDDCVDFGTTSRGTRVEIDRRVAEAQVRILLGNIEYHYFAGYSGGAKALMPGVSTREAIQQNHRRMTDAAAAAGRIKGNPVREDIEEAAALVGVDYIVNVVLDEHKEIVYASAGEVTMAHRAGCAYLDTLYRKELKARADVVIVSQGGAPKDLNLYQTQKALDNAKHAVRDGGIIILVGSCREGLGEKHFEAWMTEADSPAALIERIHREFVLGGHKAAAIALVLQHASVILVSELAPDFVKSLFLEPQPTVQAALDEAFDRLGAAASVLVMPYGGSTLPCVTE